MKGKIYKKILKCFACVAIFGFVTGSAGLTWLVANQNSSNNEQRYEVAKGMIIGGYYGGLLSSSAYILTKGMYDTKEEIKSRQEEKER